MTLLKIYMGDITKLDVDVIVNAANSQLAGGGGVDGAIHQAAGRILYDECRKIIVERGEIRSGDAVSTTAGAMNAKHIVHTVGPIYRDGAHCEAQILRSAYISSLEEAERLHAETIAFPAISTGVYHYPKNEAALIAIRSVLEYVQANPKTCIKIVIFAVFDKESLDIYKQCANDYVGETK